MIRRVLVLSLVMLLCTVWLFAVSSSQHASRKRRQRAGAAPVVAPEIVAKPLGPVPARPAVPEQRVFLQSPMQRLRSLPVNISAHPSLKGPAASLHGEAARLLATAVAGPGMDAVWSHRVQHFGWLSSNDNYSITGWGGFIDGLEPTPDGMVATVRMGPVFTVQGASGTTLDYLIETYLIANGHVHFLQIAKPPLDLSKSVLID